MCTQNSTRCNVLKQCNDVIWYKRPVAKTLASSFRNCFWIRDEIYVLRVKQPTNPDLSFLIAVFLFAIFQKSNNHQLFNCYFSHISCQNPGQDFGAMNTKEIWQCDETGDISLWCFCKEVLNKLRCNKVAHQISSDYRFRQACSEYDRCVPFTCRIWEVLKDNFIAFVSGSNFLARCFFECGFVSCLWEHGNILKKKCQLLKSALWKE